MPVGYTLDKRLVAVDGRRQQCVRKHLKHLLGGICKQ